MPRSEHVDVLLANGGDLSSATKESVAQELEAQAVLLQSQLDYVQAADEMDAAIQSLRLRRDKTLSERRFRFVEKQASLLRVARGKFCSRRE